VQTTARQLAEQWPDPDVKLWVTARSLALRRDWPEVFSFGDYVPLSAVGPAESHVLSFARQLDRRCVVSVVPRHFQRLGSMRNESTCGAPRADWRGTNLVLPEIEIAGWTCELSGRTFESSAENGNVVLDVGPLFDVLPVALLTLEFQ
jgi:(1->4)-alpha-D-glucan 1-alpha-D-glucosylmutase